MEQKKRPIHAQVVSFGAFILLSVMVVLMLYFGLNILVSWVGSVHGLLGPAETSLLSLVTTGIGVACFAVSVLIWLAKKKKIWMHGPWRLLLKVIGFFFTLLAFFTFPLGTGLGLIIGFGLFLRAPSFTINWTKRQLQVYRFILTVPILVVILIEMTFTGGNIGFSLLPALLSLPASAHFAMLGVPWVTLVSLGIMIPLFLILPRLFIELWEFRPNVESFWQEFLYHPLGIVGLVIITGIVLMAVLAPWIAPYHWGEGSLQLEDLLQPPSAEHPLGTNHRGEDIFSRFIYGAQISLLVGFAASVTAVFIGTLIGLISGYYGGVLDSILMRLTDVFLCLPTLPLMLIFLLIFGQGLQNVIFVIALLGWTGTARMVRSEALSLRERPLTEAAHALGASDTYILVRHVMPNTFPLILANMILGVVNAILGEAGIAFLGFVDIHGQPSWGILLHWAWKNAALLGNRWWWFIPPGLFIMLTTLGFVFISHTADKVVNPRLRGRRG
jgi:peptide/nickel transport system permease protein